LAKEYRQAAGSMEGLRDMCKRSYGGDIVYALVKAKGVLSKEPDRLSEPECSESALAEIARR
jgi:hypothetical protein